MAVDFGFKRIGLAVGDVEQEVARPLPSLQAAGALAKDAQAISLRAKKEEADLVILGLPVEESGREGRMAGICRKLGDHLQKMGHRVEFVDESYSSLEAEGRLHETIGRIGPSKASARGADDPVHGEAAVIILERFRA